MRPELFLVCSNAAVICVAAAQLRGRGSWARAMNEMIGIARRVSPPYFELVTLSASMETNF
ncbi:hypothetical protein [Nocardia sp. NBC_01329]|uniref:hypothetical protein n=1 Tax=Nocardia sp. NBC_01329 TaxID=2903594 RepID=UPI002E0EFB32|nr:hypothetical protein OG405_15435 [Nocardia sp. NBC_01329]